MNYEEREGWWPVEAPFDVSGWKCKWWEHGDDDLFGLVAIHEVQPYGVRVAYTSEFISDPIASGTIGSMLDSELERAFNRPPPEEE